MRLMHPRPVDPSDLPDVVLGQLTVPAGGRYAVEETKSGTARLPDSRCCCRLIVSFRFLEAPGDHPPDSSIILYYAVGNAESVFFLQLS